MSNLSNFDNIFADLAESAYTGNRPNNFPPKSKSETSEEYDFSKTVTITDKNKNTSITQGGKNLPNDGKVYLQPDTTLKTTDEGSKGLLTDSKAGYNS